MLNPTLLSENELHEEYLVRGIKTRGAKGLERLVNSLKNEASGLTLPPGPVPTMNSNVEAQLIGDLLKDFGRLMQDYTSSKDTSLVHILMSKYLHLSGRVSRLAHVAGGQKAVDSLVARMSSLKKHFDILNAAMVGSNPSPPRSAVTSGGLQRTPNPPRQSPSTSNLRASVQVSDVPIQSLDTSLHSQGLTSSEILGACGTSSQTLFTGAPSVSGYANLNYDGTGENAFFYTDALEQNRAVGSNRLSINRISLGSERSQNTAPNSVTVSQGEFSAGRMWGLPPVSIRNLNFSNISDSAQSASRLPQHGGVSFSASSQPIVSAFVQSSSLPHKYDFATDIQTSQFNTALNLTNQLQQRLSANNNTAEPLVSRCNYDASGHVQYPQQNVQSSSGPTFSKPPLSQSENMPHFSNPGFAKPNATLFSVPTGYASSVPRQTETIQSLHNNRLNDSFHNLLDPAQAQGSAPARSVLNNSGQSMVDPNRIPQNVGRPGFTHQMSKWNLRFCGNNKDVWVDDFLFRTETLARSANIGLDVLPLGMHYLLHEDALDWFWDYHRNNPFSTWAEFVAAMRHQYSSTDTDLEIYDRIRSRKQLPGETFTKFSVAVSLLASRLRTPLSEAERLEHLRANMSLGLKNALLFHPTRSVYQLQELAKKFEKLSVSNTDSVRPSNRRVSEINAQPVSDYYLNDTAFTPTVEANFPEQVAIEAVANQTTSAPNRADLLCCWNCDEMGHTYMDCVVATRNVFCFGCGAKNTYRPNCAKCRPGNGRQGGASQPLARPTQILSKATNPFSRQQKPT